MSRPHDTGERLLGVGVVAGAVAATDLAGDDGGADVLFGAPVGRVDGRVPEKGEDGGELGVGMRGEALGVVEGRGRVDETTEAGEQSAAYRGRPWSVSPPSSRRWRAGRARPAGPLRSEPPRCCRDGRLEGVCSAGAGAPRRSGAARRRSTDRAPSRRG